MYDNGGTFYQPITGTIFQPLTVTPTVSTPTPAPTSGPNPTAPTNNGDWNGLGVGPVIGILIAGYFVIAVVTGVICCILCCRKK